MSKRWPVQLAIALSAVMSAGLGPAEQWPKPKAPEKVILPPDPVEGWRLRLRVAGDRLAAGRWKAGEREANDVLLDIHYRMREAADAEPILGLALLSRAIGAAGLGRFEDAAWDFTAAQSFDPRLSGVDLGRFGEAGAALEAWRVDEAGTTHVDREAVSADEADTPPKRVRAHQPSYPIAKRLTCVQGVVIARVVIDSDGTPRSPRLVTSADPVLAVFALEAMRNWRFDPAMRRGKPLSVHLDLTVNYELPNCETDGHGTTGGG